MRVHPKLADRTCYHQYEIEPGLSTPGQFLDVVPERCLDELGVPRNLEGVHALDIGAWDGPFSFELERRGAKVTALDIQDPDVTVFNAVKELKRSQARYVQLGIYDATPDVLGTFDLVLFAGVYYHLKHPVLALQRIRSLLRPGGTLYIEGASATDYLADRLGKLGFGLFMAHRTASIVDRFPVSYFDTEGAIYPDWSNWWYPTTRCLEVMLKDSGFCNVDLSLKGNAFYKYSHRRLMGRAKADPQNAEPQRQEREHWVATSDPNAVRRIGASRADRLLTHLPEPLQRPARSALRIARRMV